MIYQQRGFALPAMGWAAIAAGVVIIGLGVALKVQSARLESCQADQVKLEAQAKILGSQIAEQNRAVDALRDAAAKKQAAGAVALRKAEGKAKVWEGQAGRLTAILTAPRPAGEVAPTGCIQAWEEIRKP